MHDPPNCNCFLGGHTLISTKTEMTIVTLVYHDLINTEVLDKAPPFSLNFKDSDTESFITAFLDRIVETYEKQIGFDDESFTGFVVSSTQPDTAEIRMNKGTTDPWIRLLWVDEKVVCRVVKDFNKNVMNHKTDKAVMKKVAAHVKALSDLDVCCSLSRHGKEINVDHMFN